VDDRHRVCALFDQFSGTVNFKLLVREFVALGVGAADEIDKLRGCYFVTKEDASVFLDPVPELPPIKGTLETTKRQWVLDNDCEGFKFAPPKLLQPYMADKIANHPPKTYWCEICMINHTSHKNRCVKTSADLFIAMTNYVCYNHNSEDDLMPSNWLDAECRKDQRKALNPTTRDVQIGAIIGQIFGEQAKTRIAKRRIDFMTGNVNSYARILNGASELESIKTYNDLAVSLAEYNNEATAQKAIAQAEKKKATTEKAANKERREQQAEEQRRLIMPICEEHVAQGLEHCLSLSLGSMKEVLKYVFNISEANMRKARAIELITVALTNPLLSDIMASLA